MKNKLNYGFTLVEMLIAITIFMIISIMAFSNYAYQQNVAGVRLGLKQISQDIVTAKNMAINGYTKNGINQQIGIYFDKADNTKIKYYTYNYGSGITEIKLENTNLIKEEKLQNKVQIDKLGDKDNILILFSSINGTGGLYNYNGSNLIEYNTGSIDIDISFAGANAFPLKRTLHYFKNTNMIDY